MSITEDQEALCPAHLPERERAQLQEQVAARHITLEHQAIALIQER